MALTVSATDTEVQKPVNVIYQQMLLENARPLAPYFVGTTPGQIQQNGGSATIKWRRYNTSADHASGIAPTTSALSELTGEASYMQGRSSSTVHFSDVTAAVSKYGQFYILNEEVDVFLPNGTMAGITRTLAISAGRSLNQLQRNVAEDNLTIVQAGGAASDGANSSKITLAAIASVVNTLARNSAMPFAPMATGSQNIGTVPLLQAFWGINHPDVAYDVTQLGSSFTSVEKYAGQVQTLPGEYGAVSVGGYAVRFVQTPDASIDVDSGATVGSSGLRANSENVDLYTTVIYGQDCLGSVGLGTSFADGIYRAGDDVAPIQMIAKGRGSGGTSDPFDEISTLAWKSWHAGAELNSNWGRAIRSGATSL